MCGGGSSTPDVVTTPEAPTMAETATSASGSTSTADNDAKRRAAATGDGTGGNSTILTSARGTTSNATTATKTLLGQ